jgi:hypothetical protein
MDYSERRRLIDAANNLIASAQTPELRASIAHILGKLLMESDLYRGFSYVAWLNGGFKKWRADGSPDDTTPYLGDKTLIRFI